MFQALIGTVQTRLALFEQRSVRHAFQALIGTVQTEVEVRSLELVWSVSSPHRYCPNFGGVEHEIIQDLVSSPHRYCPNERPFLDPPLHVLVSSPHRYCPNELTYAKLRELNDGFKPS